MEKDENREEKTIDTALEAEQTISDSNTPVKFQVFGEEMLEKYVKQSGNGGRIYLPPDWVGRRVKIIRVD